MVRMLLFFLEMTLRNSKRQIYNRSAKEYRRAFHDLSSCYDNQDLLIRRESPGKGFHHFLTRKDVRAFIELIPQWSLISGGLDYVLLARGEPGCDGWYDGTVVAINAWEQDGWRSVPADYYAIHKHVLERLNVETVKSGQNYLCKFNCGSIKAFQLLHVFLHELGHHFDKISTRSKRVSSRGEAFAEQYASGFQDLIWKRYTERFAI